MTAIPPRSAAELSAARKAAHVALDPLWRIGNQAQRTRRRRGCYRWLSRLMEMSHDECHISLFDVGLCEVVVEIVAAYLAGILEGPRVHRGAPRRVRNNASANRALRAKKSKRKPYDRNKVERP